MAATPAHNAKIACCSEDPIASRTQVLWGYYLCVFLIHSSACRSEFPSQSRIRSSHPTHTTHSETSGDTCPCRMTRVTLHPCRMTGVTLHLCRMTGVTLHLCRMTGVILHSHSGHPTWESIPRGLAWPPPLHSHLTQCTN